MLVIENLDDGLGGGKLEDKQTKKKKKSDNFKMIIINYIHQL